MTRGAPSPQLLPLSLSPRHAPPPPPPPPPPRFALKQDKLPEDGAYGDKFAKMSEKTPKKRRGRGAAAGGGDDATDGAATFGGVSTLGASSDATGGTGLSLSSIDGLPNSLDMLPGTVVSMRAGLLYQDPDGLERPMSTTGRFVTGRRRRRPRPRARTRRRCRRASASRSRSPPCPRSRARASPEFESPDAEFDDAAARASAGTRFSRASRDSGDSRPGTAKSAWSGGPGSPSKPGSPAGSPGKRRSRLSFAARPARRPEIHRARGPPSARGAGAYRRRRARRGRCGRARDWRAHARGSEKY